jgi:uncharacterized protein (DUF3084 family)
MSDRAPELRATAEDIAADADRLKEIEEQKGRLEADDPRLRAFSEESEEIARRIVPKTVAEREMADEAL